MKDLMKAFRPQIFFRQAGVFQDCLIRGQKLAGGANRDDELRDSVDDGSKFSLGFGYFGESPF
jgi:hypothetical protein